MHRYIFSVFDSKSESFMPPFFSATPASAMRSFATAANDPTHEFNKYGVDFTLFLIGEWDAFTGKLVPEDTPKSLALAASLVEQTNA